MIDLFALLLIHGLLALMAVRLLGRDDLDEDPVADVDPGPPPKEADPPRPGNRRRRA